VNIAIQLCYWKGISPVEGDSGQVAVRAELIDVRNRQFWEEVLNAGYHFPT